MSRKTELLKIQNVLCHFKTRELQKNVFPCLPQVTWETVMLQIKKESGTMSMKNIIIVLLKNIKNEDRKTLYTILLRLCVVDVSLHSYKRNWQAYKMIKQERGSLDLKSLDVNIKRGCRLNNVECDTLCLKRGEIIWFSLIEKIIRKKVGLIRNRPIFGAYFVDSRYIFFNGVIKVSIINGVLHAFLYKSFKKLPLSGRDVLSLHTLLKKHEGMSATSLVPQYKGEEPRVVYGGIDATLHKSRREFAEKCFNEDTKLETLTLYGEKVMWQGSSHIPNMTGHQFPYSLKISSSNIFSTVKRLMERNVIHPEYCLTQLKNLSRTKENKIKLEEHEELE